MSFNSISRQYLGELQAEVTRAQQGHQHTAELSYRPYLHSYLLQLTALFDANIVTVFEPRVQGSAGRPDWRFHHQISLGVYGYAEAKGLNIGANLNLESYENQVNRYRLLNHNLLITDGIDFIFYFRDSQQISLSLVPKPINAANWNRLRPNPLLEDAFRRFFSYAAARQCTEEQLITEVALRAANLSESIQDLSRYTVEQALDQLEAQTIGALNSLQDLVQNHHDQRLRSPKVFGDFVAQVLMFGLLYAHRITRQPGDTPQMKYEKMRNFWSETVFRQYSDRLRPFRALVQILNDELFSLGQLGTWYQDAILLLSHIDLNDNQINIPDYHTLYEQFLSTFDPNTRFDFGAYYTPKSLAQYMVKIVKQITCREFPEIELFDQGNKLIDPCCGTGTFLEQLILNSDGRGDLPTIVGFEILPAPYALAHYRMSMMQGDQINGDNISIILTNTLSDELENENPIENPNLIADEQNRARALSSRPITLIIGNPPSSDSAIQNDMRSFSIIERLLNDFRPPMEGRRSRQNTQKQIKNLFVQFLRWSCNKLLSGDPAILAFVLPASFAENSSYLFARRWLIDHFNKIWILDIDEDSRTGIRSSSLFPTRQGRLLIVAISGLDGQEDATTEVYYSSIRMLTKEQKHQFFDESNYEDILLPYQPIALNDNASFRPNIPFDRDTYERFWPLSPIGNEPQLNEQYIFRGNCSGIKLAPSSLLVHTDSNILQRRSMDLCNPVRSLANLQDFWFSGQDKVPNEEKLTAFRSVLGTVLNEPGTPTLPIRDYAFRPFLNVKALLSDPLLSQLQRTGGGGTRKRPELLAAYNDPRTIGFAVAPAPKELGPNLHRFVSFCWFIPDNDLCKRDNAHIFCNYFPAYGTGRSRNMTPVENICPSLVERISVLIRQNAEETANRILFYVYGILCSDAFLDTFEGALFSVDNIPPRIPIPNNAHVFLAISEMGEEMARLEDPTTQAVLSEELEEILNNFPGPFDLISYKIDPDEEILTLIGSNNNFNLSIRGEILGFEVSGYGVLDQWLKFHCKRYTRTAFNRENYSNLLQVIERIRSQLELMLRLDPEVMSIINGNIALME